MNQRKALLFLLIVLGVAALYFSGALDAASPEALRARYAESPVETAIVYFVLYVVMAGFSLPGAAILTLVGGAIFGVVTGVLLVSFASTLGATIAFLMSRQFLSKWVQKKFGAYTEKINRGVEREGAFYLFTLRMIPPIPFFVINLVFGLTTIRVWTFYWVSQVGMFAGTIAYVYAGATVSNIESISFKEVFTPGVITAFALLILLPHVAKWVVNVIKRKKVLSNYKKPETFDTNLVVIGGGSAGLVTAYIAAAVKAKVTLIEKHKMGGDCLNTGCVPSKALIRSAKVKHTIDQAEKYGIRSAKAEVDFDQVFGRVQNVIKAIEPHDSVERYTELGVDCIEGHAEIISPFEVKVGERVITTKNIVIATGARPFVPPIEGLDQVPYLTSDTLWNITKQPKRLLVMGAGPIGCELAQAFGRLGSKVTVVDMAERMMPREDADVSELMQAVFEREGIKVLLKRKLVRFETQDSDYVAVMESESGVEMVSFDQVLVAVGRKPNTEGLGLENIGIETTAQGTVDVDAYLRTKFPNILACGDVAGPYQFTHTAAHQAWYAAVNGLVGQFKLFEVDYRVIPWATFTDPEVARVGLSEQEARDKGVDFEVTSYGIDDLDRAIADGQDQGFVKVITAKGSDRILGATIVGYHASDLITEFVSAMKHKVGLNKILGTIHIYPTVSEANKYVAGQWKRAHAPERVLKWAQRFFRWQRS